MGEIIIDSLPIVREMSSVEYGCAQGSSVDRTRSTLSLSLSLSIYLSIYAMKDERWKVCMVLNRGPVHYLCRIKMAEFALSGDASHLSSLGYRSAQD